jgi:tagatose 1,6-diphosphate aldolase
MADSNGRFKMTAVDQRPPIKNPIANHYGTEQAPYDDVARFKAELVRELQDQSTAMLLDPHYALPRGLQALSPTKGLIVTLEDSLFQETDGGRISSEIDHWSVEKIKRCGADAVKVLAWYRPDASQTVLQAQQDFTKRIGEACVKFDIPFLFELLVYPLAGDADQTTDYVEMKGKKTADVLASVEQFARPEYAIDVFKLESPVNTSSVPGVGNEGWEDAQQVFNEMGELAGRPWVMLSAGAGKEDFRHILSHAFAAGASGYLAGRAIWQDAFARFPDWEAITADLRNESVPYMQSINQLTDEKATAWFEHPCYATSGASLQPADGSFRHTYPGFGD